jgi:hypothetical protein
MSNTSETTYQQMKINKIFCALIVMYGVLQVQGRKNENSIRVGNKDVCFEVRYLYRYSSNYFLLLFLVKFQYSTFSYQRRPKFYEIIIIDKDLRSL